LNAIGLKKITPPPVIYKSGNQDVQMIAILKKRTFEENKMLYSIMMAAKPDLVITIGDYWDFQYMQEMKIRMDFTFKWLPYITIETDEIEEKFLSTLQYADAIAVPTNYGRIALEEIKQKPIHVVPYGVDKKFHKVSPEKRAELREERECSDKIRFITVARNTSRKNLPALLQAVKLICHRDPHRKMQFYVHTNLDSIDDQERPFFDLRSLAAKFDVEDWFVFPEETTSVFDSPNDDYLVDEYNSSDFFVTPSICEGFGIPLYEAMACGLPVIANNASCFPEHLGQTNSNHGPVERGFLVGNRVEVVAPAKLVKVIRPDALGQAIWELCQLKDTEKMRQNCMEFIKGKSWDQTKKLLREIISSMAAVPISIPVEVMG
jgi:glycosyltransferase involved in cell wall biosynthesis